MIANACCVKTRRPIFVRVAGEWSYHTEYMASYADVPKDAEWLNFRMLKLNHMSRTALIHFLQVPMWPDAIFANPPEGL